MKLRDRIQPEMELAVIKGLIIAAQGEGFEADMALTDLVIEINDNWMDRQLAKYYGKATTGGMDDDDIRQTFLIAASRAIMEANVNIGNPMLFVMQKGRWAVVDELRKGYRKNLRQYCHDCGTETRIHEIGGSVTCPQCSSDGKVERITVNNLDDGEVLGLVVDESSSIDDMVGSEMIVQEFRDRLTGRKREVFDLIIVEGYDRTSCTNYIKEIAAQLNVAQSNVNLRLRQIKEDWTNYVEEVGL